MASRFLFGSTIPGTRSFHHFEPLTISSIGYKRISEDSNFTGIYYFSNHGREDLQVAGNDYIACKYDGRWWIGLILEVDTVQLDAQVKFMHPPGPANTFFWPLKDDVCWVPLQQIFCKIATPITATGRSYTITVEDFTTIMNVYANE